MPRAGSGRVAFGLVLIMDLGDVEVWHAATRFRQVRGGLDEIER